MYGLPGTTLAAAARGDDNDCCRWLAATRPRLRATLRGDTVVVSGDVLAYIADRDAESDEDDDADADDDEELDVLADADI
jgi:hypothetical protein